ncbi:DUF1778 domain-containing protein [Sphingomonas rosea]
MRKHTGKTPSEVRIALRLPTDTLALIDQAAAALGKSRSEFILDSVRPRSIDAVLDQRVFELDEVQTAHFLDVMTTPPKANQALKALMHKRPIWD